MPTLPDYHVHSDHSFDCKTPMIQMCAAAVAKGVTEIAFTEHFNNNLLDIDLGYYDPERYFKDLEQCRARFPKLTILAGIEIGEPHRWNRKVAPILEHFPYDLVLGSVHWVGKENVFHPNYFRKRPADKAYEDYFAEIKAMIDFGGFDILAHIDVPKRVGFDVYDEYDIRRYESTLRDIWQLCIKNNILPEINTKGLRHRVAELHPATIALQWYVEMGGQTLTLGSDAHHPDSIAGDFNAARQSALDAGLKQLARFRRRKITGLVDL